VISSLISPTEPLVLSLSTPTSAPIQPIPSSATIDYAADFSAPTQSFTSQPIATSTTATPSPTSTITGFTHPGLLHNDADFSRIQSKVEAYAEPWITGWYKLTNNSHSFLQYSPSPQAIVYRGYDGTHTENYGSLYNDIAAGYAMALRWKVSGDNAYADKVVLILNGWSSTLTSLQGTGDRFLAAGLYGYQFANVAEIMRTYSGWSSTDFDRFKNMLQDVFYPLNNDFLINHNGAKPFAYWANWDLCNMASALAIGVLTDNETMYDQAITYFKHGKDSGAINNTIWKIYEPEGLGQGQEAGRDQGHATLDFATLGAIAQMAWNQGLDLFGYSDNLILKGAEYVAKYNLGYDVPYTTYYYAYSNTEQTVISNVARGDIRPAWELLYAHYHDLKGFVANYTGQYRDLVKKDGAGAEGGGGDYGPNSGGYDQLGYGTLVYALA
jgi:hypothetical protein